MRQIFHTTLLCLVLFSGGLIGCHKPAVREKPLPDPLLTSKKPVEGRLNFVEPTPDHREEIPPPPPLPAPLPGAPSAPASVVGMLHTPGS